MERYQIITLVDITRSNPPRDSSDARLLGQQSNFNSLLQALNIRSNIFYNHAPTMDKGRLPEPLTGRGTYWVFEFETERDDVYRLDKDQVGLLKQDLDGIPIIDDLDNSVSFKLPVFKTMGKDVNTSIIEITQKINNS
jgi:hypothetical protein